MTPLKSHTVVDRSGMTLVEMLVATAATLMLMGAVAQVFSVFGSAVTNSRSIIEQDNRLRSVAWRLRTDLAGATARTLPPLSPAEGEGYFEVIEGPRNDQTAAIGTTILGADTDDILLFTTRNSETPFLGKADSAMIESPTAEVAWFVGANPVTSNPETYTLYRRQLLVVGYAGFSPFAANNNTTNFTTWNAFYDSYDISVRREGPLLVPNTLADLTRRETRFLHNPAGITNGTGFPYAVGAVAQDRIFVAPSSPHVGEDVVLDNVISFDVRIFDPAAPVSISGDSAAVPGDTGFTSGSAIANGCYVDLGHGTLTAGPSGLVPRFGSTARGNYRGQSIGLSGSTVWDTWSTHYESNGVDDDLVAGVDQGSNGLDDAVGSHLQNGSVDEPEEQETSPPYPFPLRGIEVRIRVYEPSSRQVRQVTVRQTFVPN
jgi:type II secretory pathway component PulJ